MHPLELLAGVGQAKLGDDVVDHVPEMDISLNSLAALLLGHNEPLARDQVVGLELIQVVAEAVGGDLAVGHNAAESTNLCASELKDEGLNVRGLDGKNTLAGAYTSLEKTVREGFTILTDISKGPSHSLMLNSDEVLVVHLSCLYVHIVTNELVEKRDVLDVTHGL